MAQNIIAGIDLGGTKILAGLFGLQGQLLGEKLLLTQPEQGLPAVLGRMTGAIDELMRDRPAGDVLRGLVVGAPGPIDGPTGTVHQAPNLKWKEVPLQGLLREALKVPVWVENDANLAALGEYTYGYPQAYEVMLYLTVSTGVGGGIIINGDIFRGGDGGAGEFGHMTILPAGPVCGCGNRGCLEVLASGTAVARMAREEVSRGRFSALREAVGGCLEDIDARLVAELATEGNPDARRIMEQAAGYLGIGVANLVNLFNPQAIVIGGGLSNYPGLLDQVERIVKERAYPSSSRNLRILPARLSGQAGLMGCRAWAEKCLHQR